MGEILRKRKMGCDGRIFKCVEVIIQDEAREFICDLGTCLLGRGSCLYIPRVTRGTMRDGITLYPISSLQSDAPSRLPSIILHEGKLRQLPNG